MKDRLDVRMAGLGGQGLLLAGMILGEASAVHDKKNTAQTISYAPLVRGAPSRSEVIISDEPIYFPEVEDADVFLAMSQDAYDSFINNVKPGGLVIIDTDNIKNYDKTRVKEYPITTISKEITGRPITGSIVGLGIISKLTGKISREGLINAVKTHAPKGTVELNLKALLAGFDA